MVMVFLLVGRKLKIRKIFLKKEDISMNWTELSLKKYNEIKDLYLDENLSDEDRLILQINILFGVDALKLKTSELHKYINDMKFLGEKVPKMKLKKEYKLGSNVYTLKKELKDVTVAQWIDWQNFLKDGSDTDNYPNLLSIFFFPKGETEYGENYDIEQVRQDINNHLSIAEAMSISSFFLTYQKALLLLFLLYTRRETLKTPLTKEQKKKVKKEFRKLIITTFRGD